jgi:hypothetical protein
MPEYRLVCSVVVQKAKTMRTRPIFHQWGLVFEVEYDPDIIMPEEVVQSVEQAGRQCAMGDWRPKHGRYTARVVA